MQRLWIALGLGAVVAGLVAFAVVVIVLPVARDDGGGIVVESDGGTAAPFDSPADPPAEPDSPPEPEPEPGVASGDVAKGAGDAAPFSGGAPPPPPPTPVPVPDPSPVEPADEGPVLPPRVLTPEEIKAMEEANREAVRESEAARLRKEIAMFEEIMGPLDDDTARAFLAIYNQYFERRYRELRRLVTEAKRKAEETGADPEFPDKAKVFDDVRRETYRELESLLTPAQLESFRRWWEEECKGEGR